MDSRTEVEGRKEERKGNLQNCQEIRKEGEMKEKVLTE